MHKIVWMILLSGFYTINAHAQQREINRQSQAWISVNSTIRITNKWGLIADLHERRNNFLSDVSFHFVRAAVNYWISDGLTVSAGYAHLWAAPLRQDWTIFANENRIYQQAQLLAKFKYITFLQRFRNEQRWQQKIVNNKATGEHKFTNRIRYLLSITIPVSKNKMIPALVVADELCVQFGKEVIYNRFDQNRIFVGIRQRINHQLSFDLGYMFLEQQKASGFQYDHNDTFRWFFYYTPDFRKVTIKK